MFGIYPLILIHIVINIQKLFCLKQEFTFQFLNGALRDSEIGEGSFSLLRRLLLNICIR